VANNGAWTYLATQGNRGPTAEQAPASARSIAAAYVAPMYQGVWRARDLAVPAKSCANGQYALRQRISRTITACDRLQWQRPPWLRSVGAKDHWEVIHE